MRTLYPDYTSRFPELGFYVLPGHSRVPRDVLREYERIRQRIALRAARTALRYKTRVKHCRQELARC